MKPDLPDQYSFYIKYKSVAKSIVHTQASLFLTSL